MIRQCRSSNCCRTTGAPVSHSWPSGRDIRVTPPSQMMWSGTPRCCSGSKRNRRDVPFTTEQAGLRRGRWSSPENLSLADCRLMPRASPIFGQRIPRPRGSPTMPLPRNAARSPVFHRYGRVAIRKPRDHGRAHREPAPRGARGPVATRHLCHRRRHRSAGGPLRRWPVPGSRGDGRGASRGRRRGPARAEPTPAFGGRDPTCHRRSLRGPGKPPAHLGAPSDRRDR